MAQLIVALDYANAEDALATAESLRGCPIWMKVGLELFTHEGPAVVKKLKDMGFKVMLDLKMFDIPNTVAGGVRSACLMGVDLITLHALGGERMIHAAVDAVRQNAEEGGPKPLLFAVTVLTSMAPGELPGYGENLSGLAADLAAGGQAWGLDGVVCSGHEVEAIKSRCPGLMCLTPGIRPASGSASDDQRRIMTPAQAVRIGSDFLVVGRPITKAPVPADAARAILDEATDNWGIKVNRVELKNIMPPRDIQESMEKQMRAERERREAILQAEGQKQSQILVAEGEKQSLILKADAAKQAAILKAEGEKEARIMAAEAEAQAIMQVQTALADSLKLLNAAAPNDQVVKLKALEAMQKVADGKATKIIIPSELQRLAGLAASAKTVFDTEDPKGE